MKAVSSTVVACSIVLGHALPARAQAFRGLKFLDPSDPDRYSMAHDVSGDGTTVVGESSLPGFVSQGFRWRTTSPNTLEALGVLAGGVSSAARGVSADGSVVVGSGGTPTGPRAFRLTSITPMTSLGTLEGDAGFSSAQRCSADGSVAVGQSSAVPAARGFRWSDGPGMVQLDTLPFPGKDASAWAVSADGAVSAGRSGCCADSGSVEAVRWPNGASVAEGLGDLPGTAPGSPWSAAAGISADGAVIVGGGGAPSLAFQWSNGIITALGPALPGDPSPTCGMDASADGSVIVGGAEGGTTGPISTPVGPIFASRAFVWTAANGMRDLEGLLTSLGLADALQGWSLEIATAVSDDGNIIAGYGTHDGIREGWVAALSGTPFPSDTGDTAPVGPFEFGHLYFGLRESHGFLWHPTKGPQPILPDPPPFLLGPAGEAGVRWVEGALSPRAEEQLWAVLSETPDAGADLRLLRHDGRGWSADWVSRGPGALTRSRVFDVAYEDHAGDALVVYENGLGTPRYRSYSRGVWSDERALPREDAPGLARVPEGLVRWVELTPRPGTNEVALAYLDEAGRLFVWVWNGSRWLSESAALLDADVRVGGRAFDVEYESLSGTLVVAWSARGRDGFAHARRAAGSPRWIGPFHERAPGLAADFVDLAAEPSSDLLAGVFVGREERRGRVTMERTGFSIWDLERWRRARQRVRRVDAGSPPPALPGAAGWAPGRVAFAVFGGREVGSVGWARWTAGGGWSTQDDVDLGGRGTARSLRLVGSSETGPLLVLSDSQAAGHAFHYDGGWRRIGEGPVAEDLASTDSLPFGAALSRERVLVVGDPTAGSCPHAGFARSEASDLLAFALVPRGHRTRVDQLAFSLERAAGIGRDDWADVAIFVDEDRDGRIDATERTAVAGRGYADPAARLVFFEPFEVNGPTHYVLRARPRPLGPGVRLTVSLSAPGLVASSVAGTGGASQQLTRRPRRFGHTCGATEDEPSNH